MYTLNIVGIWGLLLSDFYLFLVHVVNNKKSKITYKNAY